MISISEHGGTVKCNKGMRIEMDHGIADAPQLDVLLVPGGLALEQSSTILFYWIGSTKQRTIVNGSRPSAPAPCY